jgi:signal transduction histidine kinase
LGWVGRLLIGAVAIGWASGVCWAQRAPNWRVYKLADGLPESACIAVTISSQGKVLARHLNLPYLSELDGYTVSLRSAPEVGKSRVYQSPSGQLWTVVPEGLQEFREGTWNLSRVREIAAETHPGPERVVDPVPLLPIRQGLVLFLLPRGLMEFNGEDAEHPRTRLLHAAAQSRLGNFSGMAPARDGGLWVSATRGVAKVPGPVRSLQPERVWQEFPLPGALAATNLEAPHDDLVSGVIALAGSATNQQRLIVAFDGADWTLRGSGSEKLRQTWAGTERTCWGMSREALFQLYEPGAELKEYEEITPRQYFDVAVEPSGAFWLATSDGLYRYAPLLWRRPPALRGIASPVHCLSADTEGRVWFAAGNRLHVLQNGQTQEYAFPPAWNGRLQARALFVLKNGALVLAAQEIEPASGERLFLVQQARGTFVEAPVGGPERRLRALGLLKGGTLCVQDLNSGGGGGSCALEEFDGRNFTPLPDLPSSDAAGTNLSNLFAAQNGELWLSGEAGTAWYHDKKWRAFAAADRTGPADAVGFVELADGKIWCATQDQIWEFDGRSWLVVRRGFDRINDVQRARDGSIWVASNSGLHRFFQGTWIENGVEDGLPSPAVRELLEDPRGQLWAATTRGLSLFHPDADPDPPQTVIEETSATGTSVPAGGTITMAFRGQDKWKYTAPERLLYSYRLDEHDWSPFQELNQKSFSDLSAGKHVLQVRAMDRNCNIEPRAIKEFAVILPWYEETRLLLISCAGLAAVLFFAGLAFNRHRRLLRSYAEVERKVAERTEQLEAAGHQLLHSQKMNALGTLAAGIAHDFNNILSIIKGSAQIIEDNLDNPEKIRTRADRISTVVEQGAGIVKAMLGFSRESGEQPGPCDLNAVVEETLKLLGDRFLREVRVDFKPTAGLPEVIASKDFVQQILLNFIFNGVEAMDREKQIILATRLMTHLPPELVLAPTSAAAYEAVSVQDFGCGISAEILPRIFEPFFTTKALSSRRGTGLGLSMVYELARKLGAGLAVESTVDQGSTFTLILAVRTSPPEDPKTSK